MNLRPDSDPAPQNKPKNTPPKFFPRALGFLNILDPSNEIVCTPFGPLEVPLHPNLTEILKRGHGSHLRSDRGGSSDAFIFSHYFRAEIRAIITGSNHFFRSNGSIELFAFAGIMTSSSNGVDWRFFHIFSDFLRDSQYFGGHFRRNH
jgi:hypothetical protein